MEFNSELILTNNEQPFLLEKRIRLLELIDIYGSINKAASEVPLSYKAAWEAVEDMNNRSNSPLVERVIGGKGGGGTKLTEYGKNVIVKFRKYSEIHKRFLLELSKENLESSDIQLLKRIVMQTSARNQIAGKIVEIHEGAVSAEIVLEIQGGEKIYAVITLESLKDMGLKIGAEASALIKSSWVLLGVGDTKLSARNILKGKIAKIHNGAINSEIVVELKGGNTITSIITNESCADLGISLNKEVSAIFKASSVILAI